MVRCLAIEGLNYLDTRTGFWQQQKPMYARKRDKQMRDGARSRAGTGRRDPTQYVLQNLEDIDSGEDNGGGGGRGGGPKGPKSCWKINICS